MAKAAARTEHYVGVGWCRQMRHEYNQPWFFTCATAYFLGVEAARNLSRLRHDDGEHVRSRHGLDLTANNAHDARHEGAAAAAAKLQHACLTLCSCRRWWLERMRRFFGNCEPI